MNLSNWFAGCQSLEGVNQANCVNGRFLGLLLLATMYKCMLGVNYLQDSLGFLGYLLCSDWSI